MYVAATAEPAPQWPVPVVGVGRRLAMNVTVRVRVALRIGFTHVGRAPGERRIALALGRRDVNDSSHSSKAVQGAEILVHARLRKSEFIHEPCVVKDSGVTVHVIRRTKLPIGGAGRATGDTVRIAGPSPAHGVAYADGDGIRHKSEFVFQRSHCHIKNLAPNVSLSTRSLAPILIDYADRCNRLNFRSCVRNLFVPCLSGPQEYNNQQHC